MLRFVIRNPIICYCLGCVIPVYALLVPLILSGVPAETLKAFKLLFAFLPTSMALLITYLINGEEGLSKLWQKLNWRKYKARYYLYSLMSFAGLGLIALVAIQFLTGYRPEASNYPSFGDIMVLAPFLLLFPGFTEEFGWRGFLQERLQKKYSVISSSLLTGVVWGAWHGMDFLMGNWDASLIGIAAFSGYIILTSGLIGLLYFWSKGSIWVAIFAHFSANVVNSFLPIWNGPEILPITYLSMILLMVVIGAFFTKKNYPAQ